MGRVIRTDSPTTIRNRHRRTIAEMLRHLVQKQAIDDDAQDMAATIVFALVGIDKTIQQAITAWEKRDYWMKAERFQREWMWVMENAANLDDVIRHEAWDLIPDLILELYPRFGDIQINKMMRKSDTWVGKHAELLASPALEPPW